MELDAQTARRLKGFLLYHESDIANNIADFGDLALVFEKVFFRKPRKEEKNCGAFECQS